MALTPQARATPGGEEQLGQRLDPAGRAVERRDRATGAVQEALPGPRSGCGDADTQAFTYLQLQDRG